MGKYNNPSTVFFYFNPISGEKLDTNFCDLNFCDLLPYVLKINISEINKNEFSYLIDKNIDI